MLSICTEPAAVATAEKDSWSARGSNTGALPYESRSVNVTLPTAPATSAGVWVLSVMPLASGRAATILRVYTPPEIEEASRATSTW